MTFLLHKYLSIKLIKVRQKLFILSCLFFSDIPVNSQSLSSVIHYQGRVNVSENGKSVPFNGVIGYFKFTIINSSGSTSYWSNDGSSVDGGEPVKSVRVAFPENDGVFEIYLGGAGMSELNYSNFPETSALLRVWFSSDNINFEELKPSKRFSSVPFAFRATVAESIDNKSLKTRQLSEDFNGLTMASDNPNDQYLNNLGFTRFAKLSGDPWLNIGSNDAPIPLVGHTSVLGNLGISNNELMFLWGGAPGKDLFQNVGWVYDNVANSWSIIPKIDAPVGRIDHSAVWANDKMIIWGGLGAKGHLSSGAMYDHAKRNWREIKSLLIQDFSPRRNHTAIWTGKKMIIWGGRNDFDLLNDGMSYDPANNSWTKITTEGCPTARYRHTVVWTGKEMVIWGGLGKNGALNDGKIYNPITDIWTDISIAPKRRHGHTAIWTGTDMIVWGGKGNAEMADGYKYKPVNDTWEKIAEGGPEPRFNHTANWSGSEMVIFGGTTSYGETSTGYAFDPRKNKWRPLTNKGGPKARSEHSALLIGSDLIIFGGQNKGVPLSSPQILNIQPEWYLYRKL